MFQCFSLSFCHPLLLPLCPQACSLCQHLGGQYSLLSLQIQVLIPHRNTLTETLRIMFDQTFGRAWPSQVGRKKNNSHITLKILFVLKIYKSGFTKASHCIPTWKKLFKISFKQCSSVSEYCIFSWLYLAVLFIGNHYIWSNSQHVSFQEQGFLNKVVCGKALSPERQGCG